MKSTKPYVLVVDDMPDAADSMAMVLSFWGYDASAKYCGATALAAAGIRWPSVVLLDIGMEPMNGFEFTARLRALLGGYRTTVIAITGYTSELYQARACALNINHYFFKPANLDRLQLLLEQILVGQNQQSECSELRTLKKKQKLSGLIRA